MSVLYVTTITISCDNPECNNKHSYEPADTPINPVPLDWVQVSLPGTTEHKEFCSMSCAADYQQQRTQTKEEETSK